MHLRSSNSLIRPSGSFGGGTRGPGFAHVGEGARPGVRVPEVCTGHGSRRAGRFKPKGIGAVSEPCAWRTSLSLCLRPRLVSSNSATGGARGGGERGPGPVEWLLMGHPFFLWEAVGGSGRQAPSSREKEVLVVASPPQGEFAVLPESCRPPWVDTLLLRPGG